jgi:hypothetical protein
MEKIRKWMIIGAKALMVIFVLSTIFAIWVGDVAVVTKIISTIVLLFVAIIMGICFLKPIKHHNHGK